MVGCDELGETENGVLSPGFRSELPRDSAQREPASFFRLESTSLGFSPSGIPFKSALLTHSRISS